METQEFHLGDILSVTTGVICSPDGMMAYYRILSFMSGEDLETLALVRTMDEAKPYLLEQHPWLVEIQPEDLEGKDHAEKLNNLVKKYGEYHSVRPMHPEEDARRLGFKGKFLTIDLTQDMDEPKAFGDINWKVDDE